MARSGDSLLAIRGRLFHGLTTRRKRDATGGALWALKALGVLKAGTAAGVVYGSCRYRTWSSWGRDPIIGEAIQPWRTAAIVVIVTAHFHCLLLCSFTASMSYQSCEA